MPMGAIFFHFFEYLRFSVKIKVMNSTSQKSHSFIRKCASYIYVSHLWTIGCGERKNVKSLQVMLWLSTFTNFSKKPLNHILNSILVNIYSFEILKEYSHSKIFDLVQSYFGILFLKKFRWKYLHQLKFSIGNSTTHIHP